MSLKEKLSQTVEVVKAAVPPAIFGAIGQSIADLKHTGQDAHAAGVGAKPNLPVLPGLKGAPVDLHALLAKGPLVLTFYRGGWRPYCNVALQAFAARARDFSAQGAHFVAITPELPENAEATSDKAAFPFPVAIDAGNVFARELGLVFSLPTDLRPLYRQIGIDLAQWNGDEAHELPIPATYVLDRDGVIRWAFVEADFTQRAEPDDVLSALRALA